MQQNQDQFLVMKQSTLFKQQFFKYAFVQFTKPSLSQPTSYHQFKKMYY